MTATTGYVWRDSRRYLRAHPPNPAVVAIARAIAGAADTADGTRVTGDVWKLAEAAHTAAERARRVAAP